MSEELDYLGAGWLVDSHRRRWDHAPWDREGLIAALEGHHPDTAAHVLDAWVARNPDRAPTAAAADPTLTLARGWYDDPLWGSQEHWWCKAADGSIVDPTAGQFPVPGVAEWYREFDGLFPCAECGKETPESELVGGCCCSGRCYGRMVGVAL